MIDELYKKMLYATPKEVFENWEWKVGDYALSLREGDEHPYSMVLEKNVWATEPSFVHLLIFGLPGYNYIFDLNNLIPAPTQEQLQAMMLKDHPGWTSKDFLQFMRYVVNNTDSLTVITFRMYMLNTHWLEWENGEWIKLESD